MAWDRIRQSYDSVADVYEARFLDELDGKPLARELLADVAADASAGEPVVDLGCGPGQIGLAVRRHGRVVIGLDLSLPMTTLARARLDGAVNADLLALPLASGSIGGVVAFYSLIHLRRAALGSALGELARVLRPGGRLLVAVHQGDGEITVDEFVGRPVPMVATLFRLDELTAAFEAAGFAIVRSERREPYADERTVRLYVDGRRARDP